MSAENYIAVSVEKRQEIAKQLTYVSLTVPCRSNKEMAGSSDGTRWQHTHTHTHSSLTGDQSTVLSPRLYLRR